MAQINVKIPDELHTKIKRLALKKQITMITLITRLLNEKIKSEEGTNEKEGNII